MDRVAVAREARRRQATEELAFERERAVQLRAEIDRVVVELEGRGIDDQVFATMQAEDVELIRDVFGTTPFVERESTEDEAWLDFGDDEPVEAPDPEQEAAELREELEIEILRLQSEVAASERRQQALEAYLEALGS